jgi:hypothetical protein
LSKHSKVLLVESTFKGINYYLSQHSKVLLVESTQILLAFLPTALSHISRYYKPSQLIFFDFFKLKYAK